LLCFHGWLFANAGVAVTTRRISFNGEEERVLKRLRKATSMSTAQLLKAGLKSLESNIPKETGKTPFEIYCELDLGPGGSAVGPSTAVSRMCKAIVGNKIRKSHF
jgi:hypothetical protein